MVDVYSYSNGEQEWVYTLDFYKLGYFRFSSYYQWFLSPLSRLLSNQPQFNL